MEKKVEYQEVLETIIKSLVNNPEEVKVTRSLDEMGVLLAVKVNPQDMGIIIGHRGETIKAIRTLIKAIGNRHFARVNIKLLEPTGLEKAISDKEQNQVATETKPESETTTENKPEPEISSEKIIEELKSELKREEETSTQD